MEKSKAATPTGRVPVDPDVHARLRELANRLETSIYKLAARILRAGLGRYK